MGFIIGLFTLIMILDCIVLVLLVLIQLPKKEAGAGLAFGGGAPDALFGAGSGNVLTKITKIGAGVFFGLALILSVLQTHASHQESDLKKQLAKPVATAPMEPSSSPAKAA